MNHKKFNGKLMNLYIYDKDFYDNMNLQVCFLMFTLIKIYEDLYQIFTLKKKMEKMNKLILKKHILKIYND